MIGRRSAALLLGACLGGPAAPAAETGDADSAVTVSFDRHLSIETGAHLVGTTVFLAGEAENLATRPLEGHRAVGIPVRAARTVLLDLPLAWWFGVAQHEIFGHGGRAREFGSDTGFHLGSPWDGREAYARFSIADRTEQEILRVFAGGSESNGWTATMMERGLVAGQSVNPLELAFLASSRLVTSAYVLRTTPDPEDDPEGFFIERVGGGDVANVIGRIVDIAGLDATITRDGSSDAVIREYRRFERQAYWNALDPAVWLSLWQVGRFVLTGREASSLPLPRIRGRRILPILSADWYPEGGAASLEVVVGPPSRPGGGARWSSLLLRRGGGPEGDFWAAGAGTERLFEAGPFRVSGEAEIWTRPGRSAGGGARLRVLLRERRGPFFEVGAKSPGHWPGRPAGNGVFGRLGWRFVVSRPFW